MSHCIPPIATVARPAPTRPARTGPDTPPAPPRRPRALAGLGALTAALMLAGCAVGPDYVRPAIALPAAYKEAAPPADAPAPAGHAWKTAAPAEDALRGPWWTLFGEPELDALQRQAQLANQDLRAAAARLAQARALQRDAQADTLPRIDGAAGPTRQRPSPASRGQAADAPSAAATLWRAQASIAYEADLFGRVSRQVEAAQADAEAGAALYRSVLLALQADVAHAYFQIREIDAEQRLYRQTLALRDETLTLVQRRHDAGHISRLDLARARTEQAATQSQALGLARRRAEAEHALALLLGQAPADFSLPARPLEAVRVRVPAGLPSALLERRPDIAAAERAMAAANARAGVAQAAFFPRLSLTGALGYESAELGDLFQWSSRTFLLGPLVGAALSIPLFDGGRREAAVEQARARYEEELARYRHAVLNAFREVEDNLAHLRILASQTRAQDDAVAAATDASRLSHAQYREGSISYLDVIDTDRTVLAQRRVSVQLDGEQARATVALIRALGGGWDHALPALDAGADPGAASSPDGRIDTAGGPR